MLAQDVNGRALLQGFSDAELKEEFGMRSLGHRKQFQWALDQLLKRGGPPREDRGGAARGRPPWAAGRQTRNPADEENFFFTHAHTHTRIHAHSPTRHSTGITRV